jgi:pimeloyl-ACP methyl ester carboxylesterase
MSLLGHSASGGICLLYAASFAERLEHLVVVDPSLRVVGLPSDLGLDTVLAERSHEPWYAEAVAALTAVATDPADLLRLRWLSAPLLYAQWNAAAQEQAAAEPGQFTQAATDGFYAGVDDPDTFAGSVRAVPVARLTGVAAGRKSSDSSRYHLALNSGEC